MYTYLDKTASLTPPVRRVVCHKATEYPHTGAYNSLQTAGTYLCRRCGWALFRAKQQFHAGCGWPSFDSQIDQRIAQFPDADGERTEIVCGRCNAHLGHVFVGEFLTQNNLRHCVNSAALDYVLDNQVLDTGEAILGGGCFWGVEHFFRLFQGVVKVESGYCGGSLANPSYQDVCRGDSGHYEVVRVVFDLAHTDYSHVIKRFFEIHDPTQRDGQGPDRGQQYQSVIFFYDEAQMAIAEHRIEQLQAKGFDVATRLIAMQTFWPAEDYHQAYYLKHNKAPYCHKPVSRFD